MISRPKKKLWKQDDKWMHDRYQTEQQAPKSRDEIIAEYGYDIRESDRPPEAPRGRGRGGRGRGGPRGRQRLGDFVPTESRSNNYPRRNNYDENQRNEDYHQQRDGGGDGFRRGAPRGNSRGPGRGRARGGPLPRKAYDDLRSGGREESEKLYGGPKADYPPLISDKAPPATRQQIAEARHAQQVHHNPPDDHRKPGFGDASSNLKGNSYPPQSKTQPAAGGPDGPIIQIVGHTEGSNYERKSYQRDRRNKPTRGGRNDANNQQLESKMGGMSLSDGPPPRSQRGPPQPRQPYPQHVPGKWFCLTFSKHEI